MDDPAVSERRRTIGAEAGVGGRPPAPVRRSRAGRSDRIGVVIGWLSGARARVVLRRLGRILPVIRVGSTAVVIGSRQVRQVLQRPDVFASAPVYREVLPLSCLVDDDDPERHRRQRAWVDRMIGAPGVVDGARLEADRAAKQLLAQEADGVVLDVAAFAGAVVAHAVGRQVLSLDAEAERLQAWSGSLFRTSFNRRSSSAAERRAAPGVLKAARDEVRPVAPFLPRIDAGRTGGAVAAGPGGEATACPMGAPEGLGEAVATDIVVGLLVASMEAVRAGVLVCHELVDQPRPRWSGAVDREVFEAGVHDVMRSTPNHPLLARRAVVDFSLDGRGARIRQGDQVVVLLGAPLDAEIRGDGHPGDDGPSIMFGDGPHTCPGRRLGVAVTASIVAALLDRGIRRAPGPEGRLRRIGLEPDRLCVVLGDDRTPSNDGDARSTGTGP